MYSHLPHLDDCKSYFEVKISILNILDLQWPRKLSFILNLDLNDHAKTTQIELKLAVLHF